MKVKNKLIPSVLTVAVATTTLLSGCSSSTSDTQDAQSSSASANDKVTITYTYRDTGTAPNTGDALWLSKVEPAFEQAYPNIDLVPQPITASEGDYFAKVALVLNSDTAPDVVSEDTFMLSSDAAAGYLEPLDDRLSDLDGWDDGTFIPALKEGVTASDGKVYAVPYSTDSRGLWYNKDIFSACGLPTDWQPQNWNDILDACTAIQQTEGDAVVPIWMNSGKATGEATSMQTYEMLLYGTGEELQDENGKWIIDSQGMRDTLGFIQTVYQENYGPPLSEVLNGQGSTTAGTVYMPQGRLGILLDGSWVSANYRDTGASPWPEYTDTLGFAPMPLQNGGGTITLAGGWGFAIPSHSKHKDEAWDFIKFATSEQSMLEKDLDSGNLTTRTDVEADPAYQATPFNEQATEFVKSAKFRPKSDLYPQVSTCIQTMVEAVVTGTSIDDAISAYAQSVKTIVGDDNCVSLM